MMYIEHTPLEADPKFTNRSRISDTNPVSATNTQFTNSHEAAEATFEFTTNGDLNSCPTVIENGHDNQRYKSQIGSQPAKVQDEQKIGNQNEYKVFNIEKKQQLNKNQDQKISSTQPTNQQNKDIRLEVEEEEDEENEVIYELLDVYDGDKYDLKEDSDYKLQTTNQNKEIYDVQNQFEVTKKSDNLKINGFSDKDTTETFSKEVNNISQRSSSRIREVPVFDFIKTIDEEELLKPWKQPSERTPEPSDDEPIESDENSRQSISSSLRSSPQQIEEHSAASELDTEYTIPSLPEAILIPDLINKSPIIKKIKSVAEEVFEQSDSDSNIERYNQNNNQRQTKYYKYLQPEIQSESDQEEQDQKSKTITIVLNGNYKNLYNVGKRSKTECYLIDDSGKLKQSSLENELSELNSARQMGLDIFTKIKRLFQLSSSSEAERTEQKRKRCISDDWSGENNNHSNKYRRTENRFKNLQPKNFGYERKMAQPKSTFLTTGKSQSRKSWFKTPKYKYVKNTVYADIEFSDDECEVVNDTVRRATSSNLKNIPLNPLRDNPAHSTLNPYSTLYEKSPRDVLREQPQSSTINDYMRGGLASSTSSSAVSDSDEAAHGIKYFNNNRENQISGFTRSVLLQEHATTDREKYQKLLQNILPNLYDLKHLSGKSTLKHNLNASSRSNTSFDDLKHLKYLAGGHIAGHRSPKLPIATSTINLDDDDDDDDNVANNADVINVDDDNDDNAAVATAANDLHVIDRNISKPKSQKSMFKSEGIKTVDRINNEANVSVNVPDNILNITSFNAKMREDLRSVRGKETTKQKVENIEINKMTKPTNSLKEQLEKSASINEGWLTNFELKWEKHRAKSLKKIEEAVKEIFEIKKNRRALEAEVNENLRRLTIFDPLLFSVESPTELDDDKDKKEPALVPLTNDHYRRIQFIASGPDHQVLISKFNLNITRGDLRTLCDSTWLNDEVINFYMNLLTERSEKRSDLPRCYAMNTFFLPRLLQSGYAGVKRWTRKVDLFSKDIIPMPVHVGSVHWCMAIINLKRKYIRYYDSMGTPNPHVLDVLENYLKCESEDKRKQTFDMSDFQIESVANVPRQMNGSDCGVFSCMFAEYLTRDRPITFSQENMEYFRKKMMIEISSGELLQ